MEHLPDATFVIDSDKRIIAWNQALEAMTGHSKAEMLGQGDYAYAKALYGQRRPMLIDLIGGDHPDVEKTYDYVRRNGESLFAEGYVPQAFGGRGAYIWGTASPLRDRQGAMHGAIESIRDITERKRDETVLRESERKYQELVENANSIILRWSRDGRIIFLNEFGQRFFGYTADEISGRHVIGTIVPQTDSSGRNLPSLMDEICANPAAFEQSANENMRRNGERVWIGWTNKVVLDQHGQVAEILSIGQDITARKRIEEELRATQTNLERRVIKRTAELAAAKERAESADRVKSAFLAAMSHELRTPLNSILGFTTILQGGLAGPLNDEQRKQLGMVSNSSQRLLELINDVLDLSKIEAGQLKVEEEDFDLGTSIRTVLMAVSPLAERKGLTLTSTVAAEIGTIRSDRRRVEQILLNLLSNAVKFTSEGGISIECSAHRDRIVTRVHDTGIGIRPEDLERLFRPFQQLDSGLARNHEGTGLGLSICKRIIEMMGGEISVESEWGRGSTFSFSLPAGTRRSK